MVKGNDTYNQGKVVEIGKSSVTVTADGNIAGGTVTVEKEDVTVSNTKLVSLN